MLLPPANEVWGKVIFSQACVKNSVHSGQGGAIPACIAGGIPACLAAGLQGGCLLPGVSALGGGFVPGGVCSWGESALGGSARGGALWRPPGTDTAAGGMLPTEMHSC